MEKCSTILPQSVRYLYEYDHTKILTENELYNYLIIQNVPKKLQKKILSIYKKKYSSKKHLDLKVMASQFNDLVENYDKTRNKVDNYKFLDAKKDVALKGESQFFKYLIESLVALRVGNTSWLNKSLEQLIALNEFDIAFDLQKYLFVENEREKLLSNLIQSLKILNEGGADKTLLQILVTNLSNIIEEESFRSVVSEFRALWSSANLLAITKKSYYGTHFPSVWVRELQNLDLEDEVTPYLKRVMKYSNMKFWKAGNFRTLRSYSPDDIKSEKLLESRLLEIHKTKTANNRYMIIDLLSNTTIKKALSSKDKTFQRPIFALKRQFFNDQLAQASAIDLSIYNLINLGDEREEFLWWILL